MENRINELETKTMQDGFWNDTKASGIVLQEMKSLKNKHDKFTKIYNEFRNLEELNDLLSIEEDIDLVNELLKNTTTLERSLDKLEIETLLSRKI